MKKLLILLFMSLSLTAQSSSSPDWYDAPLEACFEAVKKGSFVAKGRGEVRIEYQGLYSFAQSDVFSRSNCDFVFRNYIYDKKEFSLSRSIGSCSFYDLENDDLLEIADVLGHKQIEVTKRYAHLCIEHKSVLINRVMGSI